MWQKFFCTRNRLFVLCIAVLISFAGCQHFQESPGVLVNEARTDSMAYASIIDNYISPPDDDHLISNALLGMQGFIGKDLLFFARDGKGFIISSSGETLTVKKVSDKRQGETAIRRIYSFVAATNPRYNAQDLAYAAIKKMVRMDDWSDFMPPEDYKQAQRETEGTSLGTGLDVRIRKDGERVRVIRSVEKSPANKAGIHPGDQVVMINDRATKDLTRDEIYALLRGQKGSPVTLTILRKGISEPLVFRITPEVIVWENIRWTLMDGQYAYINIAQFGERTAADFDQVLEELNKSVKGKLRGIILDLRNNPGGILKEVLEVASRFVKSGVIVSLEGRQRTWNFNSKSKGAVLEYPTVVLVNGDTMAGAEILAGVLQDYELAKVVGSPTGADTSIQTIFPLLDGSGLRVTTHTWRLPHGRTVENTGIIPDFDIEAEDKSLETQKDVAGDRAVSIAAQILSAGQ